MVSLGIKPKTEGSQPSQSWVQSCGTAIAINFSQQRGEQQMKGKAVLGITGSIDSGKKSP